MAASKTTIANLALTILGQSRISSINDNSKEAEAVSAVYDELREYELRRNLWSFAITTVSLATTGNSPANGRSYEYQLPGDFLRVAPDLKETYGSPAPHDWVIEGRMITSNEPPPLTFRYVKNFDIPAYMDPMFRVGLAAAIAAAICEELTQSNTKVQIADGRYSHAIGEARRTNAIERTPDNQVEDELVAVRR